MYPYLSCRLLLSLSNKRNPDMTAMESETCQIMQVWRNVHVCVLWCWFMPNQMPPWNLQFTVYNCCAFQLWISCIKCAEIINQYPTVSNQPVNGLRYQCGLKHTTFKYFSFTSDSFWWKEHPFEDTFLRLMEVCLWGHVIFSRQCRKRFQETEKESGNYLLGNWTRWKRWMTLNSFLTRSSRARCQIAIWRYKSY